MMPQAGISAVPRPRSSPGSPAPCRYCGRHRSRPLLAMSYLNMFSPAHRTWRNPIARLLDCRDLDIGPMPVNSQVRPRIQSTATGRSPGPQPGPPRSDTCRNLLDSRRNVGIEQCGSVTIYPGAPGDAVVPRRRTRHRRINLQHKGACFGEQPSGRPARPGQAPQRHQAPRQSSR